METPKQAIKQKLMNAIQVMLSDVIKGLTFEELSKMTMEDMHEAFVESLRECIDVANEAYKVTNDYNRGSTGENQTN